MQDKLEKFKIALVKLEADKRALQEELSRNENRSTKLELQRMSAEGDIQRLQMMLQEKDATIQVIKTLYLRLHRTKTCISVVENSRKM